MADAKKSDELDNDNNNNKTALKDLAENPKEMMYQQYEIAYGKQMHNNDIQKKQNIQQILDITDYLESSRHSIFLEI